MIERVITVLGSTYFLLLDKNTIEVSSLNLLFTLEASHLDKCIWVEQQPIDLLHRFEDNLLYIWICTAENLYLFGFKTTQQSIQPETIKPLYSYSINSGFAFRGAQILSSIHGDGSFVAIHSCASLRGKSQRWQTFALDMRIVLRHCEKRRRGESISSDIPLPGPCLENVSNTGFSSATVDPLSVRVWGAVMDYLDNRSSFSYSVIYAPRETTGLIESKSIQTAQQVVADTIVRVGESCFAYPDTQVLLTSSAVISTVGLDGNIIPAGSSQSIAVWEGCDRLCMNRPDRTDVLRAIRNEYALANGGDSETNIRTYKRLVVMETALAAGCGDIIGEYVKISSGVNALHDVVTVHEFCVGRQRGLFLGLQQYLEAHVVNVVKYMVSIMGQKGDPHNQVSSLPVSVMSQLQSDLVLSKGLLMVVEALCARKLAEAMSRERDLAVADLNQHLLCIASLVRVIKVMIQVCTHGSIGLRCVNHLRSVFPARLNAPTQIPSYLSNDLLPSSILAEIWLSGFDTDIDYPPQLDTVVELIMIPCKLVLPEANILSHKSFIDSSFLLIIFFLVDCAYCSWKEECPPQIDSSIVPFHLRELSLRLCEAAGFPSFLTQATFPLWSLNFGVVINETRFYEPLSAPSLLKYMSPMTVKCIVQLLLVDENWLPVRAITSTCLALDLNYPEFFSIAYSLTSIFAGSSQFIDVWRLCISDIRQNFNHESIQIRGEIALAVCTWASITGKLKELLEANFDEPENVFIEEFLKCKATEAGSVKVDSPYFDMLLYHTAKRRKYNVTLDLCRQQFSNNETTTSRTRNAALYDRIKAVVADQ